jgi:hypothetical protein
VAETLDAGERYLTAGPLLTGGAVYSGAFLPALPERLQIVTRNEVEEIKKHFDEFGNDFRLFKREVTEQFTGLRTEIATQVGGLRTELRAEMAEQAGGLRQEIAEVRRHAGVVAEDLRSEIRAVGEGVALANERIDHVDLRVDTLTGEVRRGFAGVRAEIHRLHETDDELGRRIEAQERRGA